MVERRLPRWSELLPLLRPRLPQLDPVRRRLDRAVTIADLRRIARRRTPRAAFDYTDGAADAEISMRRARALFAALELRPSVLRDVAEIDTATTVLGRRTALPFGFSPTGFTRLMHHEGEPAVARVAERREIPYALSTLGTTSVEDVAAAAPTARKWFQLYVWRDRSAGEELMRRATDAGFEALVLTVDVPVAGSRLRDVRNGLTIPPSVTPSTLLDMSLHPAWWLNLLTTEPLRFASLESTGGSAADLINRLFDPTMTIRDLDWIRSCWTGPLIVKGIQTVEDARRMVDAGADALVVSNHGGRQLDRAPVPLRVLPDVVDAVGDRAEVYVDGGITSGADVVAAVALGARLAMCGRAYLYGLMAGGERGVDRAAQILTDEVRRTMALLGVNRVEDLGRDHVRLP